MSIFPWKKKKPTGPVLHAGQVSVGRDSAGLVIVKVSGVLTPQVMASAQSQILAIESQGAKLRGLVDGVGFQGWAKGFDGGMGELERMYTIDEKMERMAVVAEESFHESLGLFMGAWTRKARPKFFTPAQMDQAKAWLKE